jgi:hypothetical protein
MKFGSLASFQKVNISEYYFYVAQYWLLFVCNPFPIGQCVYIYCLVISFSYIFSLVDELLFGSNRIVSYRCSSTYFARYLIV